MNTDKPSYENVLRALKNLNWSQTSFINGLIDTLIIDEFAQESLNSSPSSLQIEEPSLNVESPDPTFEEILAILGDLKVKEIQSLKAEIEAILDKDEDYKTFLNMLHNSSDIISVTSSSTPKIIQSKQLNREIESKFLNNNMIKFLQPDNDAPIRDLEDRLTIYEQQEDIMRQIETLRNLAYITSKLKNTTKALSYLNRAEKILATLTKEDILNLSKKWTSTVPLNTFIIIQMNAIKRHRQYILSL